MVHLSEEEKICTLALMHTPGIGAITVRQLISYCGSAQKVFASESRKLLKIPGVGEKMARTIRLKSGIAFGEQEYNTCLKSGTHLHFYMDATYPTRLKPLYDAPIVLYSRGNVDFNRGLSVGIVGTRQISDYGKRVTEAIVRDLSPYDATVISGLAYGVDITAHRACVKHNLSTIGVLASGLNVIYPEAHIKSTQEMMVRGGIVTENALMTRPDFMRFPARNRIIAGLADVTIVVESGLKGGSMITVEFSLNYHREVYAVPGNLGQAHSEGCNALIRDNKASLFTAVEDMALALGWHERMDPELFDLNATIGGQQGVFDGFSQNEGQVLSMLYQHGPMQLDEIAWQSGLHLNTLANILLSLEFQGMVKSLPGKKYGLI
ncbi:DNA processing protein [Dyadobacter jejuensis]|uniref:DNA processing protein n=1 Tax=Dyadobacter jejuensis TaxID=1082580 RepID=A0A316AG46_9BACT|nr:DNA-processing protein DprA [Dyadobacter jejuensis]PWJ56765.1 DNA processing protein [Dyadobacter jejuensis]